MAERPQPIKSLKPGNFIMIEGEPCKILDITYSKPGKHGATKARIEGMGQFDGKRRFLMKPSSDTVYVPEINKRTGQVLSVSGDIVQLMDLEDYSTLEAIIPEELKSKIEPGKEIPYWKIGDKVLLRE